MTAILDLVQGCISGRKQPTRQQLQRLDSKLICCPQRSIQNCGLKLSYLITAFQSVPSNWTTQDVLSFLIIPQTQRFGCRYIDIIPETYVGTANYLVSYSPGAPFRQQVYALHKHFHAPDNSPLPEAEDAYLWIDAFAINHHVVGCKPEYYQVEEVLAGCKATLLVLDGRCQVLSRLLPLFEIWATQRAAKDSKIGEPKLQLLPTCADARYLRNEYLHLDVRNASVLREFDKGWVLNLMMGSGVARVNNMVRQALADAAQNLAAHLIHQSQAPDAENLNTPFVIHDLHVCAMLVQLHGRYNEAVQIYKQAVDMWTDHNASMEGENPLPLLTHYAELLLLLKDWSAARSIAEDILKICAEQHLSIQHGSPTRIKLHDIMSGARYSTEVYATDRGQNAAAAKVPDPLGLTTPPELPATILLARALMGQNDPDNAQHMVRVVAWRHAQRKPVFSRVRRDRESQTIRRACGLDRAKAKVALADILRLQQKPASEAIKLYLKAQRRLIKALGPSHPDVAYIQMRIGQLLRNQRKYDQAQALLVAVLDTYCKTWGEFHPETASAMVYLADIELATLDNRDFEFSDADLQSALQKATRQYMQAFEIRRACLGVTHPDTLATLAGAIVQLLNSATTRVQLARIEPFCELAVKCSMTMQGGPTPRGLYPSAQDSEPLTPEAAKQQAANQVSCMITLAMVLATAGKAKDASLFYDRAAVMADNDLPEQHQLTAHKLVGLADLQHAQHDWQAAEANYRKAAAIYAYLLESAPSGAEAGFMKSPSGPKRGLAAVSMTVMKSLKRLSRAPHMALARDTKMDARIWDAYQDRSHRPVLEGNAAPAEVAASPRALKRFSIDMSSDHRPRSRELRESRVVSTSGVQSDMITRAVSSRFAAGGANNPLFSSEFGTMPTGRSSSEYMNSRPGGSRAAAWYEPRQPGQFTTLSVVQENARGFARSSDVSVGPSTAQSLTPLPQGASNQGSPTSALAQSSPFYQPGSPRKLGQASPTSLPPSLFPVSAISPRKASQTSLSGLQSSLPAVAVLPRHGSYSSAQVSISPTRRAPGRARRLSLSMEGAAASASGPLPSASRFLAEARRKSIEFTSGELAMGLSRASSGSPGPQPDQFARTDPRSQPGTAPATPHQMLHHSATTSLLGQSAVPDSLVPADGSERLGFPAETAATRELDIDSMLDGAEQAPALFDLPPVQPHEAEAFSSKACESQESQGNNIVSDFQADMADKQNASFEQNDLTEVQSGDGHQPTEGLVPVNSERRSETLYSNKSGQHDRQSTLDRRSMFQRIAYRASKTLNRVLPSHRSAAENSLATSSAALNRWAIMKEHLVQLPKMSEAYVSPHQLIMRRRGKLAERPHALLQLEASVVANNLGLLTRWTRGPEECEKLLANALMLSTPNTFQRLANKMSTSSSAMPLAPLIAAQSNAAACLDEQAIIAMRQAATPPLPQLGFDNLQSGPAFSFNNSEAPNVYDNSARSQQLAGQLSMKASQGVIPVAPALQTVQSHRSTNEGGAPIRAIDNPLALDTPADPQVSHVRALVLNNLAALRAAQGRTNEAEKLYQQAIQLCTQVSRRTDAMLVALNLIHMYCAQGRNVAALETAKEVVGPHLGISLGLEAVKRLGGRYQAVAMKHTLAGLQQGSNGMAAIVESDIPHAGRDAEKGTGQDTLMPDQFDLQFQIIEALAARMADDGGQVLYQWAAEAMTMYELQLKAHRKLTGQQGGVHVPRPRLPEIVFMLQLPGIHLQCIHMVRWLVMVQPGAGAGLLQGYNSNAGYNRSVSNAGDAPTMPVLCTHINHAITSRKNLEEMHAGQAANQGRSNGSNNRLPHGVSAPIPTIDISSVDPAPVPTIPSPGRSGRNASKQWQSLRVAVMHGSAHKRVASDIPYTS